MEWGFPPSAVERKGNRGRALLREKRRSGVRRGKGGEGKSVPGELRTKKICQSSNDEKATPEAKR